MDSSYTYLFKGLDDGQKKKILATGKEISMKKGQQIFSIASQPAAWKRAVHLAKRLGSLGYR